jgi:hypothetical protein
MPLLDELVFNARAMAFFDAMPPHNIQNFQPGRIIISSLRPDTLVA